MARPDGAYAAVDAADAVSHWRDLAILLYPVATMANPYVHAGSRTELLGRPAPTPERIKAWSLEEMNWRGTPPLILLPASTIRRRRSRTACNCWPVRHARRQVHPQGLAFLQPLGRPACRPAWFGSPVRAKARKVSLITSAMACAYAPLARDPGARDGVIASRAGNAVRSVT